MRRQRRPATVRRTPQFRCCGARCARGSTGRTHRRGSDRAPQGSTRVGCAPSKGRVARPSRAPSAIAAAEGHVTARRPPRRRRRAKSASRRQEGSTRRGPPGRGVRAATRASRRAARRLLAPRDVGGTERGADHLQRAFTMPRLRMRLVAVRARHVRRRRRDVAASRTRDRTAVSITCAARLGSSCSHTRITLHPDPRKAASSRRSRLTFRSNLARQYSALALGLVECSGHRCQKHPSTKTATRAGPNMRSGRTLRPASSSRRSFR